MPSFTPGRLFNEVMGPYKPPEIIDASIRPRRSEFGFVDAAIITTNAKDRKIAKVRTRQRRVPEIGDKFASRHGQKGTVGMYFRQEDMPWSVDGIIPDLIINPHCIPSRMTIGHILETLYAKANSVNGKKFSVDATPFNELDINEVRKQLTRGGTSASGSMATMNPFTGRMYEEPQFTGPVYYQKLKHMVLDKVYSRCRGFTQAHTRQPIKGRINGGGLRFG